MQVETYSNFNVCFATLLSTKSNLKNAFYYPDGKVEMEIGKIFHLVLEGKHIN